MREHNWTTWEARRRKITIGEGLKLVLSIGAEDLEKATVGPGNKQATMGPRTSQAILLVPCWMVILTSGGD